MITPIRQQCHWQPPSTIAKELINTWGEDGLIWLNGDGSKLGRWVTLAVDPVKEVCCQGLPQDPRATNPFQALRRLTPGHWTGWLSYEAGAWIEPNNPWKADTMATLWLGCHDPILRFDLKQRKLWIEGLNQKRIHQLIQWLEELPSRKKEKNNQYNGGTNQNNLSIPLSSWQWLTTQNDFARNVELIKAWIKKGDIFQANLTASCSAEVPMGLSAIDIFEKLRVNCPSPFSGIIIGKGFAANQAVISASPERFLCVTEEGVVETRPIKGTRPRETNPIEDANMAAELICSEKDRAENIMIVDLLRNDLGRVCKPGSISVSQLLELESYQHVHHLTSVIHGSLQSNKNWVDLLEACWPGGSISGAPKLRACKRLYELEPKARGPYCGSIINLDWNGRFDSNILIRSLLLHGKTLRANAGCGIVADSDAQNEAEEMNWKLIPLLEALQ